MRGREISLIVALCFLLVVSTVPVSAESSVSATGSFCAVYFTGNGCPHCAKVKPAIDDVLSRYPNLILIKYEIYDDVLNAPVIEQYGTSFSFEPGIPIMVLGKDDFLEGDNPILSKINSRLKSVASNPCPLPNGSSVDFALLNVSSLPGHPEILRGNSSLAVNGSTVTPANLTVLRVVWLAIIDAVNPCVYAMVVLILLAIITRDPKNRRGVLLAGLAFSLAVFLIYFIYGAIIILFFQSIQQFFGAVKPFVYASVAVLAIILGIINIRDFFSYAPGRMGSEMPIMFRPKVKKIISRVTSPGGAFAAGAFVTLFLLPCTAGPYVILGGILSSMQIVSTLPWLLFYNLIFVLPIVILTVVVYSGFSSVEKVSGWREQNIRYLHLVEGILILVIGILMLFGWL
jgi:cytochrome c biogenesis protein CcdA